MSGKDKYETFAKSWLIESYGPGEAFLGNRASELLFNFLKSHCREGTGVLIPASSCHALAQTVILANYIPVFVDIDLLDLNMSLLTLAAAFSESECEVSVCIAVHSFGNYCELKEIKEFCSHEDIILVEDVCQLTGSGYEGRSGDVVLASFGYSKPVCIGGGGGMVIRSVQLQDEISRLNLTSFKPLFVQSAREFKMAYYAMRDHEKEDSRARGSLGKLSHSFSNYILHGDSLPSWHLLPKQLSSLPERNSQRLSRAQFLQNELLKIVDIQLFTPSDKSIPWRFPFLVRNANLQNDLTAKLRSEINHVSNWYQNLALDFVGENSINTPNATIVEKSILNLWVDNLVNDEYLINAVDVIKDFFKTGF